MSNVVNVLQNLINHWPISNVETIINDRYAIIFKKFNDVKLTLKEISLQDRTPKKIKSLLHIIESLDYEITGNYKDADISDIYWYQMYISSLILKWLCKGLYFGCKREEVIKFFNNVVISITNIITYSFNECKQLKQKIKDFLKKYENQICEKCFWTGYFTGSILTGIIGSVVILTAPLSIPITCVVTTGVIIGGVVVGVGSGIGLSSVSNAVVNKIVK